jgi:hypothetical protein
MKITDPFTDRPDSPWGLLNYRSSVSDLFLPHTGALKDALGSVNSSLVLDYNEGSGYIGLISVIGIIIFICSLFVARLANRPGSYSLVLFLSIIPSFLFATQWPLTYFNQEVIESIPFINQFRGSGRFIWVLYYTLALIGSSTVIYTIRLLHSKSFKYFLLCLLCSVAVFEAHQHLSARAEVMRKYSGKDLFTTNNWISTSVKNDSISISNISAIITIPPSTTGSEKMNLYDDFFVKIVSWPFSYQKGVPLTAINLSRTPLKSVLNVLNLTCNSCYSYDNNRHLDDGIYLIVIRNNLLTEYRDIINRSSFVDSTSEVSLYSISKKNLLYRQPGCSSSMINENESILYHKFLAEDSLIGYPVQAHEVIAMVPVDSSCQSINVSFWNKLRPEFGGRVGCTIKFFSEEEKISSSSFSEMDITRFEVCDNWINLKKEVRIPVGADRFDLSFEGLNVVIDNIKVTCSN